VVVNQIEFESSSVGTLIDYTHLNREMNLIVSVWCLLPPAEWNNITKAKGI
jgi:hypothetical protein